MIYDNLDAKAHEWDYVPVRVYVHGTVQQQEKLMTQLINIQDQNRRFSVFDMFGGNEISPIHNRESNLLH